MSSSRWTAVVLLGMLASGCARGPINTELAAIDPVAGYRPNIAESEMNSDGVQVLLAFSGGGTRAAAFSYGVLKALRETKIAGGKKTLLDEVDVISTISGGSFTGAYYATFGDRIFEDYERRFLKRNIQGELASRFANPLNWPRLLSPYFNRIHLVVELYDETVFDRATYATLVARKRRPFLIVNGTTMSMGTLFHYTQDQFDVIGSDLSTYPVAAAVATSSAFPILLSPMTLRNYPAPRGFEEPAWVGNAIQDQDGNIRRYLRAKSWQALQRKDEHRWIHLVDGGLADNLGVRPLIDLILDPEEPGSVARLVQDGKARKVAILIVNAKVEPPGKLDRSEAGPDAAKVVVATMTTAMENYSYDSVEWVRDHEREWQQARKDVLACQRALDKCKCGTQLPSLPVVETYLIEVAFDRIADKAERERFLSLPTSFKLPPDTVDRIEAKAAELLRANAEFQRLVKDLQ